MFLPSHNLDCSPSGYESVKTDCTLAQFSTSGELGLLAAVVTFKRPLKMEYSGDIKRYALYLLISEGFFH